MRIQPNDSRLGIQREAVLRWIYLGRLILVSGILVGALVVWPQADPTQTFIATLVFLASFALTGVSFGHTQIRGRVPSDNFVYLQVIFDALLVTAIVHITEGADSPFSFLYILVISSGALLLPLPGGVLVGALATVLFLADAIWLHLDTFRLELVLKLGLFATVALVTGLVGDRVRRAGLALGRMENALRQLRLDTGDILANIATGVMTVDSQGRLVYLNPAGEAILGLSYRDWMGREVLPAVEAMAPGMGSLLEASLARGEPVARLKSVAQRKGSEVVLGISTTVLEREAGARPSVTAIFQDITGQERLNVLHRRAERLEAVAELSASLAHEIKNPLASIRSAVEQLSGSALNGEDRQVLQRLVVAESERLEPSPLRIHRVLGFENGGLRAGRSGGGGQGLCDPGQQAPGCGYRRKDPGLGLAP